MGRSKVNRRQHSSGHNDRNRENTSQVRASKRPELQRQTDQDKSPRNKNKVEEESSDNDRDHQENEHAIIRMCWNMGKLTKKNLEKMMGHLLRDLKKQRRIWTS